MYSFKHFLFGFIFILFIQTTQGQQINHVANHKNTIGGISGINGPRDIMVSADNKHLYVCGGISDGIAYFSINNQGNLTFIDALFDDNGSATLLNNPRSLTQTPDGKFIFVGTGSDDAITVFSRDSSTGTLTWVAHYQDDEITGGTEPSLEFVAVLKVSPDGKHLYSSGSTDDALSVYSIESDGKLTFLQDLVDIEQTDGTFNYLDNIRHFTIDQSGNYLYTSSQNDDAITVFTRDTTTGELTLSYEYLNLTDGIVGLDGVKGTVISNDDTKFYACGGNSDGIVYFTRNPLSGELTYVDTYDNIDLTPTLDNPTHISISKDGQYLFVACVNSDALVVLSINADGSLSHFSEFIDDNQGGTLTGLDNPDGMALSPNGDFLYVTSANEDNVNFFNVRPTITSIKNLNNFQALEIYPNPTNSMLTVKGNELSGSHIKLINSSGIEVAQYKLANNSNLLNLHSLETGTYTLMIENKETYLIKKLYVTN